MRTSKCSLPTLPIALPQITFQVLSLLPEISNTRIILNILRIPPESVVMLIEPDIPAQTRFLCGVQAADCGRNLALALHYLQSKTGGRVPGCWERLVRDTTTLFRLRTLVRKAWSEGQWRMITGFLTDMTMQKPHPWIIGPKRNS